MATAKRRGAPASTQRERQKKPTQKEKSAAKSAWWQQEQAKERKRYNPEIPTKDQLRIAMRDKSRPTEYDEVLASEICMLFATDPKMSLTRLNADVRYPTVFHFYAWMDAHPPLLAMYTRAREAQYDLQAEEVEEWTASPMLGTVKTQRVSDKDGTTVEIRESDNVERTKLRVATRQWVLSKLRPRKYGLQPIEVEGNDALKDLLSAFRQRSKEIADADS
jgi:hypothetical protein